MATYGSHQRRGLPRQAGGPPWPPADDRAPATIPATDTVEAADSAAEPMPSVVDQVAPVAAAIPEPDAVQPARGASSFRRGLPRVPGGEAWPPLTDAQSSAAVPAEATPAIAAEAAPASGAGAGPATVPEPAVAELASTPAPAPESAAADAPIHAPVAAPTGGPVRVIRRGLPRVAGGESWPLLTDAQSNAPALGAEPEAKPEAAEAAEAEPTAVSPGVPTIRRGLPRTAGDAPASAPAPAATPGSATASAAGTPSASGGAEPTGSSAAPAVAQPAAEPAAAPKPVVSTPDLAPAAGVAAKPAAAAPDIAAPDTAATEPRRPWSWRSKAGIATAAIAALVVAAFIVLLVRWLVTLDFMQSFLADYPGEYELPAGTDQGFPAWVAWQHFFNMFFIVLIIRTGLQVRTEKRPTAFWTPKWSKSGKGKISLALWLHQSLDVLWLLNGIIFVVLLFATGHWARIVPTSLEVFPNALSAVIQYVSLDWPTENGWVNYNSLQQLAYFATVFLAAPLAAITGVRMSGLWPKKAATLNRLYPVEVARALHFPVMLYFVVFIIFHVALVLATGALRNLNHMYAGTDVVNWVGFWIFAGSIGLVVVAWLAARPVILAPIAKLSGKVTAR